MSRTWNGDSLVNEYATMLGDIQSSFQIKVLGWINDIVDEICTAYTWGFLRTKGQVLLTTGAEEHTLYIPKPSAPTVALTSGGSLTDESVYKIAITFVDSNGAESIKGVSSSSLTASSVNATITLTNIPVSTNPLVTARNIYIQKDGDEWFYYSQLADNTTTTTTVTTDSTSSIEAPDRNNVIKIDGNPFLETSSHLEYRPLDQLRSLFQGEWSTGTPEFWSDLWADKIVTYPAPSSALTLSFYYYMWPSKIIDDADSEPGIPQHFRSTLRAGVKWKGYEYREREDAEAARVLFHADLNDKISNYGTPITVSSCVRDVEGDSDGYEVQ